MGTFQNFEQIEAWKKARQLSRKIYQISGEGLFSKDFGLRDQIRRASVSIMSNIAEGLERGGRKEFVQFLSMAKGSVGEIRAHLYVALDQGYIHEETCDHLLLLASEVGRMIGGLMNYLRGSKISGSKFKSPQLETRNSKLETSEL